MQWNDLVINGTTKSMTHLQPFEMTFDVAGQALTVKFEFGFHCFTDDKGNGELLRHKHERRYFCASRYKGLYAGIPEISVSPAPVPPRAHPGR